MNVRRFALLALVAFVGCSRHVPYSTSIGLLEPNSTMTVSVKSANINVYKPKTDDPSDRFTVQAMALEGAPPPPPVIRPAGKNAIDVDAPDPLLGLLVRVPDKVNLIVNSEGGNVNVTDITGFVNVHAKNGKVKIMVDGTAEASNVKGDVEVTIGAQDWKGTLTVETQDGDANVFVPEVAKFHVVLHTDDGVLYTDFPLTGTSHGSNETIDKDVNGGGGTLIIKTHHGAARLLRLTPQA